MAETIFLKTFFIIITISILLISTILYISMLSKAWHKVTKKKCNMQIYTLFLSEKEKRLCKTIAKSLRKDRDSNPGNAFDVYTLSRRASSTTRASFLICECKDSAFWVYIAYLLRFFLSLFVIVYAFDSRRNRCEDFVCDCV